MQEKVQYRLLAFACLLMVLVLGVQNMSAQDFRSKNRSIQGRSKDDQPVFIEDEPGDTSRWAAIRDIFMSPADRKKSSAPGLIPPSATAEGEEPDVAVEAGSQENLPRLRGILLAGKRDFTALFTEKLRDMAVKKGDVINDYTVTEITRNSVTLEKNGKEIVLYVQE